MQISLQLIFFGLEIYIERYLHTQTSSCKTPALNVGYTVVCLCCPLRRPGGVSISDDPGRSAEKPSVSSFYVDGCRDDFFFRIHRRGDQIRWPLSLSVFSTDRLGEWGKKAATSFLSTGYFLHPPRDF